MYEGLLSLPLYPKMSDADAEDVIRAVLDIASQHRREIRLTQKGA
jgi:dTDP-4-amino-4,6-dideoxygalactose transaminase